NPSFEETLCRDQLRAAYIHTKVSNASKELQQSAVTVPATFGYSVGTAEYVITVSLGTPAVAQVMNIDTGSDVSWVQCAPCAAAGSCYSQKDTLFDPTSSGTTSSSTATAPRPRGRGSDTLSLTSSDAVSGFQFGHRAAGFVGQTDGLMGLGGGAESLVSQTAATYGEAFAYCLPPPSSSSTGFLTLGAAAAGSASSSGYARTPMAITVAGTQLSVPPSVFSGASVVDSETVITQLPPTAYQALRTAFRNEMKAYPPAAPVGVLDTCFNFDGFDQITVTKVTLTFSGGAAMDLDVSLRWLPRVHGHGTRCRHRNLGQCAAAHVRGALRCRRRHSRIQA
ncbi:LOW QUALITY PROTEIN: hypothetical protein U9M48_029180, partial [Paspalum notatum var. saurae]